MNAEEYDIKWPNHCRTCNGTGVVRWQENQSPLGSGLCWMQDMIEVCDDCVAQGVCPQCGAKWLRGVEKDNEETFVCDKCGWDCDSALVGKIAGRPIDEEEDIP